MATIRLYHRDKFPALVIIMRLHSNTQVFYVSQGESVSFSCFTAANHFVTTEKALTTSYLKLNSVSSVFKWLVLSILCLSLSVC
ncbi:hypothetical protein HOLleu_26361 [Holothuria leucospilota]|uniref:Uncharacterized protein n=1 Tax=Holothuria leucospilota TaxID=206669 RepID=A0A9Q1H462_HOLLE|nr:hypothetical protein HOLleu_26361 [Holothuria leucospilota]